MSRTFETSKGLRRLLIRLRVSGPRAWENDPEARELMAYCIGKYQALALKHRCDPTTAAAAAFEAMRTYAVRTAVDPWAVVTMAVKVSLIAEERATGLLCSVDQARRTEFSSHHDVRRFSDTDADLPNLLPQLAVEPVIPQHPDEVRPTGAFEAVDAAIAVFTELGWPVDTATCLLDYIGARLVESGSRPQTHAALRRDESARALLDIDQGVWSTVLRIILGNPNPDEAYTSDGHGILLRLLIGHHVSELMDDDLLVFDIRETAPRREARVDVPDPT
ncbi:serine/arginine repetitive matrix protein 2 [Nocardioides sp. YIM 152315]|uniref:serine/arginine repetitive matrix protein 2 n=1 Tax=Nocardioides sp. YIM 152315 TaxID=3031760 RepID=UPI0023DA0460|nr:serine/arginine repetitive matrix protein 2 [Nocardioides sp. YIM 152315]MDF1605887.1 serine/arginine repetitive matrix protein 2 [Nocardioides sp. YIM 152315]